MNSYNVQLYKEALQPALQPYLKRVNGDWYRYTAHHWRSDADGDTLAVNWNEGTWKEHKSGDGGHLPSLAKQIGINIQGGGRMPATPTKRRYSGMADYAQAHGITVDTLRAYGWQETSNAGRPALMFPTTTKFSKWSGGWRYRYLDGNTPKYTSEKGYTSQLYGFGARTIANMAQHHCAVMCNGEISTIVAHQIGMPAFCITGGERSTVPNHLIDELKQWILDDSFTVIVALDCDDKGRDSAMGMVTHLKQLGIKARAVDLGLTDGGDLADFCMLYSTDAMSALVNLPDLVGTLTPLSKRERFIYMPFNEMRNLPKAEWLIGGVIQKRGFNVIFGAPGQGKTFVALHYALSIAQSAKVMYVAGEGVSGLYQRGVAWCTHNHKDADNLYMVIGNVAFMDDTEFGSFKQKCQDESPEIIFIDTLARAMSGADENSTRDMGMFVDRCDELRHDIGCTIVIVHHTGKAGYAERGSSVLRASADIMQRISMTDGDIRVECEKSKDSEPFDPMNLTLLPVKIVIDGDEIEVPVVVESAIVDHSMDTRITAEQRKVLDVMCEITTGTLAEINEHMPAMKPNSLHKLLSKLKSKGLVSQTEPRQPYSITDEGRKSSSINPKSYSPIHHPSPLHSTGEEPITHFVKLGEKGETVKTVNSTLQTLQPLQREMFPMPINGANHWEV